MKRTPHALNPRNHRMGRWQVDYDYIAKLSPSEREWLAKFTDEYMGGRFRDTPLHPPEKRKSVHDAKNARTRDLANYQATELPPRGERNRFSPADYMRTPQNPEDAIIELVDSNLTRNKAD